MVVIVVVVAAAALGVMLKSDGDAEKLNGEQVYKCLMMLSRCWRKRCINESG